MTDTVPTLATSLEAEHRELDQLLGRFLAAATAGDPEAAGIPGWVDASADARWSTLDAGDLLRSMDRFHQAPDLPEFAMVGADA